MSFEIDARSYANRCPTYGNNVSRLLDEKDFESISLRSSEPPSKWCAAGSIVGRCASRVRFPHILARNTELAMTLESSAEIEVYVDQAAMLVDLPIDPAYRKMVLTYFALSARMAESLYAQPLALIEEPAPVFEP